MTVYSGTSPFSRGKLGGARGIGMKMSRGGAKKRFRINFARRKGNEVTRTGTAAVSKGNVTFGMTNSGQGLIRNANAQQLTSAGGLTPYDAFGIIAAGGDPVLNISCTCGTDFASAVAAFEGKKNIKPTLTVDGVEHVGILDTSSGPGGSMIGRGYRVVFPQFTSLFSVSAGTSTAFKIEFTT